MKTTRITTRARILSAAIDLFAERGHHGTTIRDIVIRSDTNQAAVNYHFGSKDELYREVYGYSLRRVVSRIPAPTATHELSAAPLLHAFVREMLDPLLSDERTTHTRLMAWEQLRPTGLLSAVKDKEIKPHLDFVRGVVHPFLGENVSTSDLTTVALWLVGQCFVYHHASSLLLESVGAAEFDIALVDALADRVAGLALAALTAPKPVAAFR